MEIETADEIRDGFFIYNATDHVLFDPRVFATQSEARDAAEAHRAIFKRQGYYLTVDGLRIDPAILELEIVPVTE